MTGLDLTFDGDGRAITDLGSNQDRVNSLISVANGKILAVGVSGGSAPIILVRYNADGILDNSFGVAGKLATGLTGYGNLVTVAADGKIIVAGSGLGNQGSVARFLANGQPDTSFGTNGLYSIGNNDRINNLSLRVNPIDNSNEIIINHSAESALYYLQNSTLLDANGKIKPFPIGSNTAATPLVIDQNVLNGILSSTTIDKTNPKVQNILSILGEPLINQLRSKFSKIDYNIGVLALKDGSTAVTFTGTSSSSQYISSIAHFGADGKFDPNFGSSGLMTLPLPPSYQGIASIIFDKKDGLNIAIYNSETQDISVNRYTKNGQLDSTFGNNGKVTLPQIVAVSVLYAFKLSIVVDSQNGVLVLTGVGDNNSVDVFRFNNNGTNDTTFGTNGKLQLSGTAANAALLGADNRLFLGSSRNGDIVVSKYDLGGTTIAATTITDFKKDPAKYMGSIRDYDGNDLGGSSTWKSIGEVDINRDGTIESILVNPNIERFASVGSVGGNVDFTKYGLNGDTRVVGIYIDPTLANSPEKRGGPFDSQRRFQNDLKIDNLTVLAAGDYNNDGFQDLYFKLGDGTATLRALMHADGNINYANYQSKSDLAAFMTANNVNNSVWGSWL